MQACLSTRRDVFESLCLLSVNAISEPLSHAMPVCLSDVSGSWQLRSRWDHGHSPCHPRNCLGWSFISHGDSKSAPLGYKTCSKKTSDKATSSGLAVTNKHGIYIMCIYIYREVCRSFEQCFTYCSSACWQHITTPSNVAPKHTETAYWIRVTITRASSISLLLHPT